MREGYGKNKLFFLVAMAMVGSLLLPGGENLFGKKEGGTESEKVTEEGSETSVESREESTVESAVTIAVREDAITATGNGVVWKVESDNVWVVTAAHVLEKNASTGQVVVTFTLRDDAGSIEMCCNQYEVVQDADLAFLCLDREGGQDASGSPLSLTFTQVNLPEKESYDALQAGAVVQLAGLENGNWKTYEGTLTESWIYVEDFAQYMLAAKCAINPGMSGCGLYDENHDLIGIVSGGNEDGELVAVPLPVVEAKWEKVRDKLDIPGDMLENNRMQ